MAIAAIILAGYPAHVPITRPAAISSGRFSVASPPHGQDNVSMTADTSSVTPKPRRRWLQFSLRTLLLLMVPVACVAAWSNVQSGRF